MILRLVTLVATEVTESATLTSPNGARIVGRGERTRKCGSSARLKVLRHRPVNFALGVILALRCAFVGVGVLSRCCKPRG